MQLLSNHLAVKGSVLIFVITFMCPPVKTCFCSLALNNNFLTCDSSEPTAQALYVAVVAEGWLSVPRADPKSREKALYASPEIPAIN